MKMRSAELSRKTKETDIKMSLDIGSKSGGLSGTSGIGFFDHMLNSFAVHGGFKIVLECKGDLRVDGHHTVEDIGIVLGKLFEKLLGDRGGIKRFGNALIPMDESLAQAVVDISGRPYLIFEADFSAPMIGDFDTQLASEFFRALVFNMGATMHIKLCYGVNDHHKCEAVFKAVARALAEAVTETENGILSAKGVL